MTNWAIIPAAGVGQRMQSAIPKQYLPLDGQQVIDHALTPLINHPAIRQICVALSPDDHQWAQTRFARHPDIVRVVGGTERRDSVLQALHMLAAQAEPEDWVLVHDAARPYLHPDDLENLITQVTAHPTAAGGLLGQRAADTLKQVGKDGMIHRTLDRSRIWHAFTPQMCRFGLLYQHLQAVCASSLPLTDEASVMEWAGESMLMVPGRTDNRKITYPEDLD
ncbi:MAG: 2-C-methyl-D-erythritol 4-phosphate cytidylyltransferase [Pseudomonadota bacterium]